MRLTFASVLRWAAAVLLGAVVGVVGTFTHRSVEPLGLVLAFAAVLSAAVWMRAWAGLGGVLALGLGWVAAVQVLALAGPGGDVLVPAQPLGYLWVYGGLVFVVAAAFAPRRWFEHPPVEQGAAAPAADAADEDDPASVG
ncbi:MAG: DUF6113 family protein [Cellulomonadaceae bacterium]